MYVLFNDTTHNSENRLNLETMISPTKHTLNLVFFSVKKGEYIVPPAPLKWGSQQ